MGYTKALVTDDCPEISSTASGASSHSITCARQAGIVAGLAGSDTSIIVPSIAWA